MRKTRKDGEDVFQVRGDKPERWVRQTDFANDEAVGYLADRLNAAGVEDELMKAGAVAGDTVVIGDLDGGVVFDWEPDPDDRSRAAGFSRHRPAPRPEHPPEP